MEKGLFFARIYYIILVYATERFFGKGLFQMNFDLQRAGVWKRISAAMFDYIMMAILAIGIATGLSAVFGYDGYVDRMTEYYRQYEEAYGIDLDITQEVFDALTQEEKDRYGEANLAMNADAEVVRTYNMMFQLAIAIVSVGLFLSHLILEFLIPLFLRNGQTLGKKIFGVAVMSCEGVKISGPVLFVRAILGKYTIETMIPAVLIAMILFGGLGVVGTVVLLGMLLLQIGLFCFTKNHYVIHELLSDTVSVDMASQRIFESREELIDYKKRIHAEEVANSSY